MKKPSGFTLIELSIVLVIISLIVGGVIGGKALIKSAKIQNVITEVTGYKTAIQAFKLQYDGFPGDIREAYDYWGVAAGCTDTFSLNPPYSGCNGNGNGTIETRENRRAWQHLSLADIIPGTYAGVWANAAANGGASLAEYNSVYPPSATDGNYTIVGYPATGNRFHLSSPDTSGSQVTPTEGTISPPDARLIDKKLDDGAPSTGSVMTQGAPMPGFSYADCIDGTRYDVSITTPNCIMLFFFN